MLIYNGQVIAGGGTIVLPMTRAEYEANKAVLDTADVWVDLTDEPDQVATADQIAYSVDGVQKSMGYIGDIATKAVAKVEPTDTALYLHEVGTYFINKDGNACKVDIQIPVNGTITLGTNCHVCSNGVANELNNNLSNVNLMFPKYNNAVDFNQAGQSITPTADQYIIFVAHGTGDFALSVMVNNNQETVVAKTLNNETISFPFIARKNKPFIVNRTGNVTIRNIV